MIMHFSKYHLRHRYETDGYGETFCGKWARNRTSVIKKVNCTKCKSSRSFLKIIKDRESRRNANLGRYLIVVINKISSAPNARLRLEKVRRPSMKRAQLTLAAKSRSKKFIVGYVYDSRTNNMEFARCQQHK